jgi:hypothetical protein
MLVRFPQRANTYIGASLSYRRTGNYSSTLKKKKQIGDHPNYSQAAFDRKTCKHHQHVTAALTRGSALGVRVQLRALFVLGGVLVLIVCC